jgi:hypothetical protein
LTRESSGELLRLVETVDLVDEEDRGFGALPGALDDGAHVLDAGGHRAERLESGPDAFADQPRDGRLAGAGRPPQHEGGHVPGPHRRPQRRVRSDDRVLAQDLLEALGPQPLRERHEALLHARRL